MLKQKEVEILKLIADKGIKLRLIDIAKRLKISKSYASKLISRLVSMGLIKIVSTRPNTYQITELGKSFLNNKGGVCFRSDSLRIWFSVYCFNNINNVIKWLEEVAFQSYDMRGWRKYRIKYDDVVIIEVNMSDYNPSVELVFSRIWVDSISFLRGSFIGYIFSYVWKIVNFLAANGIVVDIESMRITNHEFEAKIPEPIAQNIPDGVYSVDLNRKAINLLGQKMKANAKAWIDASLGYKEHGSNDAAYWYKFLLMPELVWELNRVIRDLFIPAIEIYTANIKEHLAAIKDMRECIREIRDLIGIFIKIMLFLRKLGSSVKKILKFTKL